MHPSYFETASADATTAPRFLTASLATELGILLSLSLLFPFMVHILPVPDDARIGARLLPMFYAPLLAALLGRPRSAFVVAAVAPWLNWALTSHPTPRSAIVTMLQLLVFVWVVRTLVGRLGARWFLAVPAYAAGMLVSMVVAAIFPDLISGRPLVPWILNSMTMALPGVAVLLLINWLAVRYYPPSPGGGGPIAA